MKNHQLERQIEQILIAIEKERTTSNMQLIDINEIIKENSNSILQEVNNLANQNCSHISLLNKKFEHLALKT